MESFHPQQDNNVFAVPQITNPPLHQYFGSNDQDTSPMMENFPMGPFYGDENDAGNMDDSNEAKRRRIARACDMCRKKKIKCDGKMPACSHCINYKTECIFTQVEKKRAQPKGAKYIEGLENRLGRMESLLKQSGLVNEEDWGRTDLGTIEKRLAEQNRRRSSPGTPSKSPTDSTSTNTLPHPSSASQHTTPQVRQSITPNSSAPSPSPAKDKEQDKEDAKKKEKAREEEVEALSDMMCSLVTNNCGETRYIGSSSGFSIFSPKGIQWVNEKTGDSSFQEMISSAAVDDNKWVYWKPEIFSDMFVRRTYMPLPPRDEALSLLKDFFENFNCMFPLFHEPTFMHLVNKHYTKDPYEGSGWWASLNVALAIAHRLRVMSNIVPQEDDNKAWAFLKNAMGVLTELTMRNTDLLSVQALLGMAMFLLGTPNPQPSFFLVSAALRLSHSIGLHKRGSGFNLNPIELEQRKRVFWIAYILDKDICLRSGRPPAQDDDDMNVELPTEDPSDNIGSIPLADGKGKANLFRLMCTFAIIESKVYKQLYSTKASKQSDGALLNTIGELDKELEEWKDSIPLDFRPENEIKASHTPLILHIVVLHFAYYNCLTTIHRMSVHHGYWSNRLSNYAIQGLNARPLNPRVFMSAALCVTAARASIHLIKYIPQGDYSCVWLILYFPVSSLVTLFANILQNPQDARARSDVRLMNQVVTFLSILSVVDEQGGNGGVKRMLGVCAEFERIAKVVLDKSDKENFRRKRKSATKDSISESTDQQIPQKRAAPQTPSQSNMSAPATTLFTPNFSGNDLNSQPFNPSLNGFSPAPTPVSSNEMPLPLDFSTPSGSDFANMLNPASNIPPDFGENGCDHIEPQLGASMGSPFNTASFQQPFVPQDLWQMPMTLEWDWADMTNMGYPPYDASGQQQQQQMPDGQG